MQVAYTNMRSDKEKPAELYAIGNSLLLEVDGKQHRIILSVSQWKLLAESALERAGT